MLSGLLLTAGLMGAAGVLHCAAMCGSACAVAFPRGVPLAALWGRSLGYSLLGALAAVSTRGLMLWGQQLAALRPLWMMSQFAALVLALWVLWQGRMPATWDAHAMRIWQNLQRSGPRWGARLPAAIAPQIWPLAGGMLWAAMPCGLLYAALTVASLANSSWGGAAVMLAFSMPSAVGVWAAPRLLAILGRRAQASVPTGPQAPVIWMRPALAGPQPGPPTGAASTRPRTDAKSVRRSAWWPQDPSWAVRMAALSWIALAGYALAHQVMVQWRVWCA